MKVIRVPGNHDEGIGDFWKLLYPIRVVGPTYSLEGVEFSHGHQFDPVTNHIWAPLTRNRFIKRRLPQLYLKLYGTPGYVGCISKDRWRMLVELYNEHYERLVLGDGISRCFGHTHFPFVTIWPPHRILANAGSASDGTWLEITKGKCELFSVGEE